ncbi:MAG: hypothetical protein MUC61_03360 [Amoebophilaceae bacterium]|jgi:hypothetical protein|nr:hypothetical protein [Amoebophilaceae bacterium]
MMGVVVARVLGNIKRRFGRLEVRYVGMATTHEQHVLEAITSIIQTPGDHHIESVVKTGSQVLKRAPGSHNMGVVRALNT